MMKIQTLVSIALALPFAFAANVTLVRLDPSPTLDPAAGTLKVTQSIVGATPYAIDQNSYTLYRVTEVEGPIVFETGTVTSTILAQPTTTTWTYKSGVSGHSGVYSTIGAGGVVVGVEESCKNLASGTMDCTQGLVAGATSVGAIALVGKTTATGVPFATITNVESLSLPTTSIPEPAATSPGGKSSGTRTEMHYGAVLAGLGMVAGAILA